MNARRLPKFGLGFGVIIACTLLAGIAHGYLDGRWLVQDDLEAFGRGLDAMPADCGDWHLAKKSEIPAAAQEILRCHGSIVRDYVSDETGKTVSVAIVFGPRGPTAVHVPEICFTSVGTELAGPRVAEGVSVDGTEQMFWKTQYIRSPDTEPSVEVWYAWSDGGSWVASKQPRFWMTENLFKIQLAGSIGGDDDDSGIQDFLVAFLPEVQSYLSTL